MSDIICRMELFNSSVVLALSIFPRPLTAACHMSSIDLGSFAAGVGQSSERCGVVEPLPDSLANTAGSVESSVPIRPRPMA
jgi:hypothetical protein